MILEEVSLERLYEWSKIAYKNYQTKVFVSD